MTGPIQRRGEWWQQQPDGSWLRWDETENGWQPQEFPPPPPESSEAILQAWSAPPVGSALQASPSGAGGPMAPTPGYKYARGNDGTWWARNESSGELHWHDAVSGQWRLYVFPESTQES